MHITILYNSWISVNDDNDAQNRRQWDIAMMFGTKSCAWNLRPPQSVEHHRRHHTSSMWGLVLLIFGWPTYDNARYEDDHDVDDGDIVVNNKKINNQHTREINTLQSHCGIGELGAVEWNYCCGIICHMIISGTLRALQTGPALRKSKLFYCTRRKIKLFLLKAFFLSTFHCIILTIFKSMSFFNF